MFKQAVKYNFFIYTLIVTVATWVPRIFSGLITLLKPSWAVEMENAINGIHNQFDNWIVAVIALVIITPIIETLIFQVLAVKLLSYLSKNIHFCAITSGLVFGLVHFYHPLYILMMFGVGTIWGYAYCRAKEERSWGYAFWVVCVSHILLNGPAVLFYMLEIK